MGTLKTKGGIQMKKLAFLVATSALLVACGDKDEANNVPDNAPVEQNQKQSTSNTTTTTVDAAFNFTHFDLDIEYVDNKSYEVSYENEAKGAEVKIEDEVNNSVVQGTEATNTLIPIFESFTFDANTDPDTVIDEVLQKFGQPNNFISVEIDIQFADGTKKEYRRTQ